MIPFGLTNAPTSFMNLMNKVFQLYLDQFVVVFIDDILIYSNNKKAHDNHLRKLLKLLREKQLYAKFKKCEFWLEHFAFLGHIISKERVSLNPMKVETIEIWPRPTSVTEVHNFLRLADYYQRFVKKFSRIAVPLTQLIIKSMELVCRENQEKSFLELKKQLISTPVLTMLLGTERYVIYKNA